MTWKNESDKTTTKQASDFLFKRPDKDGKDGEKDNWLDTRSDVHHREMFGTLTYYRLLQEQYGCQAAGDVANILERLLISNERKGRFEAVTIVQQKLPKEETIYRGIANAIAHTLDKEE